MVGEELHSGSSQGLVGAGIAQVNLQSHLCEQTTAVAEPCVRMSERRGDEE